MEMHRFKKEPAEESKFGKWKIKITTIVQYVLIS